MSLTSKQKLAEQAQRMILGGQPTQDRDILIQELLIFLEQAFATIIRNRYFQSKAEGDPHINGSFIYPFVIEIKKDSFGYYSDIPETSVSLPRDLQIYSIYGTEGDAYIPVANGFNEMFQGLEAGQLEGRTGYYVEEQKIRYSNMRAINKPDEVRVRIIAPTGDVDAEDPINIPEDIQLEIVQMTVAAYTNQQKEEKDEESDLIK